MKKRIICVVLALTLAVSAIVISASAEKNTLNFGVLNTATESGYEVTLTVSSDYLCAGMQSIVEYDTAKLTYTGTSDSAAVDALTSGKIKISKLADDVNNGVSGKLIDITFLSKKPIFEDDFTLSNVKGVAVKDSSIFASEVTEKFTYGDCNKDKKIDVLDYIRIKKMAASDLEENISADMNQDGEINGSDLVVIKKVLLGVKKKQITEKL